MRATTSWASDDALPRAIGRARPLVVAVLAAFIVATVGACSTHISQAVDDATLAAHVRTALLNDATIGSQRIDVAVHAGVVTLSGTVKSSADQQRAIALARGVSGVIDVKSNLQTGGQATQASVRIRSGAIPSPRSAAGISSTSV